MSPTLNDVVERVQNLALDEKEELKFLIDRYIIEERRNKFYHNYQEGVREVGEGTLQFSTDTDTLKKMLDQ